MFELVKFLWHYAPRLKYVLIVLAFVAGFSRDGIMMVVNWAAASVNTSAWLSFWLPAFIIGLIAFVVTSYAYRVITKIVVTDVVVALRLGFTRDLFRVFPNFISKRGHGQLYHIMTADASTVANFSARLLEVLPAFIFLCIAIPQVFWLSWVAGILVLVVMFGGALAYYRMRMAVEVGAREIRRLQIAYFERVTDIINGFREIRLNQPRRDALFNHAVDLVTEHRDASVLVEKKYAIGDNVTAALKFSLFGCVIFLVPTLAAKDSTMVFQLITIILFSMSPFESILGKYPEYIGTKVSFKRIMDLHEDLTSLEIPKTIDVESAEPFASIEFKDVLARYAARETSKFELGPINLRIEKGEVLFVVGSNGSGKTTFLNILAGLMEPSEGDLFINDEPANVENAEEHRARISAVFIDYYLFRKFYGYENLTQDKIVDALNMAGLEGLTTVEDGAFSRIDLSAGQRRRLALAVALLEDRDVIILDEFVADQDPDRRKYFFEQLVPTLKARGKTVIVATHDLAWKDWCDRLIRFEDGKVSSVEVYGRMLEKA